MGEARIGMSGGATTVVKFHVDEKGDIPAIFFAFARQKYFVLWLSPLIDFRVSVTVESFSMIPDVKFESDAICSRNVAAPTVAYHRSTIVVA
jgi:hypothetical protein